MVYESLKDLFAGICDAIRNKDGSVGMIEHQDIPDRILELKSASGGNAVGSDIREGKTAYVNGELVEGTLSEISTRVYDDSIVDVLIIERDGIFLLQAQNKYAGIYSADAYIQFHVNRNRFGNAAPENVDFGVTFTSAEGICMTGERPVDAGNTSSLRGVAEADSISNLHYWEKMSVTDALEEEIVTNYQLSYSNSSLNISYYGFTHYADEISITDGVIALVDPIARGTIDSETLRGKYIQSATDIYRIPEDATVKTSSSAGATSYTEKYIDRAFKIICVTSGTVSYVVSSDSDAFPKNGTQDSYTYQYKGTLNEEKAKAVIESLTITENGTYTAPEGIDGYSPVTVNIPAIIQPGTDIEASALGDVHYWSKTAGSYSISETYANNGFMLGLTGNNVQYADAVTVSNGELALVNPKTYTVTTDGDAAEAVLLGKYVRISAGYFYRVPTDAVVISYAASQYVGAHLNVNKAYQLKAVAGTDQSSAVVLSTNRSAYPDNGALDGYTYVYQGTLSG